MNPKVFCLTFGVHFITENSIGVIGITLGVFKISFGVLHFSACKFLCDTIGPLVSYRRGFSIRVKADALHALGKLAPCLGKYYSQPLEFPESCIIAVSGHFPDALDDG